jgi:hypothetical protein
LYCLPFLFLWGKQGKPRQLALFCFENEEPVEKKSKHAKFSAIIYPCLSQARTSVSSFKTPRDVLISLKREMAVFEANGTRPVSLERVYRALLTLPPTSVEAERSFSAAGFFVTKMRSSLSDDAIDMLCFLRSYLKKDAKK